jgi:L-2,4-diaminobutyrate decarboxylase
LRVSDIHRTQLAGLENADSLAISAHKLMFQPKGSALVMFSNSAVAHQVLAARSGYLSTPNIGLLGSRPAAAVPLFLTLLAWGRKGLASRIERCLAIAGELADCIEAEPRLELLCRPQSGIVVWRPQHGDVDAFFGRLRPGVSSVATVKAQRWIRNVAANPMADAAAVFAEIQKALSK